MKQASLTVLSLPYADTGDRTVRVYVPAHEEGETLPVIYMTDGQNLFEQAPGAFGCWHTPEALEAERQSSGKAAIIVGIHNDGTPQQRACELTPASIGPLQFHPDMPEEVRRQMIPQGESFDSFVLHTVMPAVEERFPVRKGRAATAFCGSSSGGVQAFYTVLSHPDVFSMAGVFSPAMMMYRPQNIAGWVQGKAQGELPYLYLYSGGEEGLEQIIRMCTEGLAGMLGACYPPERLKTVILPEKPHHESAWEEVFRDFLHIFLTR